MGSKCNGLIDWKSSVPKQVAQSTTESELQGTIEGAKDVVYARALLHDLGYEQHGSTKILIDSNTCMSQINAVKGVVKARHYVVLLRKLQELKHMGIIHAQRVDSRDNVADMFTKALEPLAFWRLSSRAMGDSTLHHGFADFRDQCKIQEVNGGRVTQVKAALRQQRDSAAECASHTSKHEKKEQAREEQRAARDLQRATNAMCMALMARVIDRPDVMQLLTRQEDDPD